MWVPILIVSMPNVVHCSSRHPKNNTERIGNVEVSLMQLNLCLSFCTQLSHLVTIFVHCVGHTNKHPEKYGNVKS